jgi:hypothetical protein
MAGGTQTGHNSNGAMDMISLMSVKAAQDLNVSLSVPSNGGGGVRPEHRGTK